MITATLVTIIIVIAATWLAIKNINSRYTLLELFFSNKSQRVRKKSKMFWVKVPDRHGAIWVKFSNEELKAMKDFGCDFANSPHFVVEDWRLP